MGDRLIAKQEIKMLEENYEVVCVDFSSLKKITGISGEKYENKNRKKSGLKGFLAQFSLVSYINILINTKKIFSSVLKEEKDTDIVILAGGNMIMDLTLFPIYTAKAYTLLKTAKKMGKKTALMFVGAGPLQNYMQKLYVKKIIDLCEYISVRDKKSKELLNSICSKAEITQAYDPVLSVKGQIYPSVNAIGVSVYFGTDESKYSKIKNSYKRIIEEIKQKFPTYKIILFSSEKADYKCVDALYEALEDKEILIEKIETEDELLNIYRKVDILLGARMHSLITALVMRTPVIGFCWQEKVWGLAEMIDMRDRFYPIDELDKHIEQITDQVTKILEKSEDEKIKIDEKLIKISEMTKKIIDDFKERI